MYSFNSETGALQPIDAVSGITNPSFLAIDDAQRYLYAVNESGDTDGAVLAYSIQPESRKLTYLNAQSTLGATSCHVSIARREPSVLVANYMGGNICLFPLQSNGEIGPMADQARHAGSSVHPGRQKAPHPHSVFLDPAEQYAFAPDLGIDRILIYKLGAVAGKLIPHGEVSVPPGSGPRHLVFHPSGLYVYVINELNSTIIAFAYDAAHGALRPLQTVPTLPQDSTVESTCADIHISPSGKFLYGSNRGHDSIVVYAIHDSDGTLQYVEHASTLGETPRNFAISPDGAFLLAANQDSDSIVVFHLDPHTGKLAPTGNVTRAAKPACIKMC